VSKYAAFLRGINAGGRIVKMADLKTCLEAVGLKNVHTLLQSGNVLFESTSDEPELKKLLEVTLSKTFDYPAKVQIMSIDTLQLIVGNYPFGEASAEQHDYVIFIENKLEKELLGESYELADGEQVKTGAGVVYWRVNKGSTLQSDFAKRLGKAKYKDFNTNRNLKTLRKMLALAK
jgi:uncharacterized protein (DUF1697 family)